MWDFYMKHYHHFLVFTELQHSPGGETMKFHMISFLSISADTALTDKQ